MRAVVPYPDVLSARLNQGIGGSSSGVEEIWGRADLVARQTCSGLTRGKRAAGASGTVPRLTAWRHRTIRQATSGSCSCGGLRLHWWWASP